MWKFWIDTGGTFTDCLAEGPDGRELQAKVLSNSSLRGRVLRQVRENQVEIELLCQPKSNFFKGYELTIFSPQEESFKILEWDGESCIATLDTQNIAVEAGALCSIRSPEEAPLLAIRLLLDSSLDKDLPPMELRLATTKGTNALLERKVAKVAFLVTEGFGDLLRIGNQQRPDLFALGIEKPSVLHHRVFEISGRIAVNGDVLRDLDEDQIRSFAKECSEAQIDSVAIALINSYLYPDFECRIQSILSEAGIPYVSVSHQLSPSIKLLPRAETAVVDSCLAPIMDSYLDAVQGKLSSSEFRIMSSAGGLSGREQFRPKDSLLSGPAGGVVGSSNIGLRAGEKRLIAFDMGGTSTDVSRFDGQLDYQFEHLVGSARVFAPSLRIETVAAGGGSICWYDGSALRVGPQSAGADPGPACYGAGGPLTLTDVNLLLGRLDPDRFSIPIFRDHALRRLDDLIQSIASQNDKEKADYSILQGFLDIANERMVEAIRSVSVRNGYDPSGYALVAFGGAGGLHACDIAEMLGMDTIIFPSDSGLLSAYGLKKARLEQFGQREVLRPISEVLSEVPKWLEQLESEASALLVRDGVDPEAIVLSKRRFEMRYAGQDSSEHLENVALKDLELSFRQRHQELFGFTPQGLPVELVSIRVIATTREIKEEEEQFIQKYPLPQELSLPFVDRSGMPEGFYHEGPCSIQDDFSTVFLKKGWRATVGSRKTLRLRKMSESEKTETPRSDIVELELFTNRYLSIVEEMGSLLERTAFSTNVKERRDFSCALLDSEGYLVANAPHIPVHLGALGVCLRSVVEKFSLEPGDVIVTNHPGFGGSHLPDITLLAGAYSEDGTQLGYVANRAHHAEVGGIAPGSMPPNAKNLMEEGVVISPTYFARGGEVDWRTITRTLSYSAYPSRAVRENIADLTAQLASIRLGVASLEKLARNEGVARTMDYMSKLRGKSARVLRSALDSLQLEEANAIQRLDDGSPVSVKIYKNEDHWIFDFEGSGETHFGNYNATTAIVNSAVIYALRLLVKEDVPLNEGFLDVVEIKIPTGMLNPDFSRSTRESPPVVAGNVEVSQKIVSTLIRALGLAACSQGTMNNLIFGSDSTSYYETIAGGEGATADRDGASGTHTHMTNTAITDPEILELRFPARVESFSIRKGSGGSGRFRGGDGIARKIKFLEPLDLALLSQHREHPPFGMNGGASGKVGSQILIHPDGRQEALPGNCQITVESGSSLEINTPGGGGWGSVD